MLNWRRTAELQSFMYFIPNSGIRYKVHLMEHYNCQLYRADRHKYTNCLITFRNDICKIQYEYLLLYGSE